MDANLLTLFNAHFPLQLQVTWTIFRLNYNICMRVISALQMKDIMLGKWQQLPKIGRHIGTIGLPMSGLWEWMLTYRKNP